MKNAFLLAALTVCVWFAAVESTVAQPWAATNSAPPVPPTQIIPQLAPPKPVMVAPPQQPPPALGQLAAGILAFDAETKEYTTKPGEMEAKFAFNVTNVSPSEVTITHVQTSCGCTVAHVTYPWKIPPGGGGVIPLTMNLAGKSGTVFKSATVMSDKGQKMLTVKAIMTPPEANPMTMGADREKNRMLATTDRQAVFKGDCASCHVEKAVGKMGKELYDAACGICHEAEHRATMVTDLHNLKLTPNAEYWKLFIVNGKPGTLMPAFAQAQGGPLSDLQIASLVDYLVKDFPAGKTNAPDPHAGHNH